MISNPIQYWTLNSAEKQQGQGISKIFDLFPRSYPILLAYGFEQWVNVVLITQMRSRLWI